MISALQSTPAVSPAQTSRPSPVAERGGTAPAAPVRQPEKEPAQGFQPGQGFGVAGSTLVAAQEEAGRQRKAAEEPPEDSENARSGLSSELSEDDQKRVQELQARDREVRAHEQAHARVGGQYASAPSYEMERGPDGKSYAVGGHVSISTAPVPGDPEATIRKMETVRRAALAPAEPSGQDRRVAAAADAKRTDARAEINEIRREETQQRFEDTAADGPDSAAKAAVPEPATADAGEFEEGFEQSFGLPGASRSEEGDSRPADGFAASLSDFGDGDDDATASAEGFSSRIEDLSRTLDRAIDGLTSAVGGTIGRLDAAPLSAGEAQTTTRRTGVDIRV